MPARKRRSKSGQIQTNVQLTVEAELLDQGLPAPKPGILYVIPLMLYRILSNVQGEYSHPLILVGHHLPDLDSPQFHNGVRHRLHLTRHFPEHATILNKFEDEARIGGMFFCLSFEVLN